MELDKQPESPDYLEDPLLEEPGEIEEPNQIALYDYLYKDSERIASYYAQLFAGHLTSLENSDGKKDTSENVFKVNAGLAGSGLGNDTKRGKETTAGSRRIVDPHDLRMTDVLNFLTLGNHVYEDYEDAPNGSLVIARGNLFFVDRLLLEAALSLYLPKLQAKVAAESLANAVKIVRDPQENVGGMSENEATVFALEILNSISSRSPFPSSFILETFGSDVCGTIKESGLQETIGAHYAKHGSRGLSDVYVLGIKDDSAGFAPLTTSDFLNGALAMASSISEVLLPEHAIRVTPIAMFRKIL